MMDVEIVTKYWKGCGIVNGNEGEMKQHKSSDACNLCERSHGKETAGVIVTFACCIRNCFVTLAWWWREQRPQ
jgi:hypothetical protein